MYPITRRRSQDYLTLEDVLGQSTVDFSYGDGGDGSSVGQSNNSSDIGSLMMGQVVANFDSTIAAFSVPAALAMAVASSIGDFGALTSQNSFDDGSMAAAFGLGFGDTTMGFGPDSFGFGFGDLGMGFGFGDTGMGEGDGVGDGDGSGDGAGDGGDGAGGDGGGDGE